MRDRRDANRKRLKAGLTRDGESQPRHLKSQGSYAMKTMVQYPDKDYDIDDGVYFARADLVGRNGGDKTPAATKEMVRQAVHDDQFKRPPEVRTNCVRVYYDAGYHVDLPVYRIYEDTDWLGNIMLVQELASTEWRTSNPTAVTEWYHRENKGKSPDTHNGGQLRRINRDIKKFMSSRDSWRKRMTSGFAASVLTVEHYHADAEREDRALYMTMKAICDRLKWDLEVNHPTVDGEKLTRGPDDAGTRFLREKLEEALANLEVLFEPDCSREQALKAWGKVFNTTYFADRLAAERQEKRAAVSSASLIHAASEVEPAAAVEKRGGGTYA